MDSSGRRRRRRTKEREWGNEGSGESLNRKENSVEGNEYRIVFVAGANCRISTRQRRRF